VRCIVTLQYFRSVCVEQTGVKFNNFRINMNKLFKVCLVATAVAFAAGCAKDTPAPAPIVPVKVEKVKKVKTDKFGKVIHHKKDVKK